MRNFLARYLLFFFKNDIICFGGGHLMFAFICVKEGNSLFLETALRLGLNIRGSTRLFSIILNLTEFLFLLIENITPEVKTC